MNSSDESSSGVSAVERAILQTVAYADVFDYPLTAPEIHYYLVAVPAPPETVEHILGNGSLVGRRLTFCRGYFILPGREQLVETRRRREAIAARMWPKAVAYGTTVAKLPFVRMVALTGALAVRNVGSDADIDYLIVTEADRLWLCRATVIMLVKLAARRGDIICPNYFLSERALLIRERSLYTAHELVQTLPIAGLSTYRRMRQVNTWVEAFLPNAWSAPQPAVYSPSVRQPFARVSETLLRTRFGGWLERWEMERKVARFNQESDGAGEAHFGVDWCKGHFDHHGRSTLAAFEQRLHTLRL
jgi:hypothetical protein